MKNRCAVLRLALAGSLFAVPHAVRADSFSVFVGYTDMDHSKPAYGFPSPLCSTFGPTCQVEQGSPLDGGVFRIDNTGSNPISISNITVTLNPTEGPTPFALWSDVTIAPGGMATFGQTSEFNFDTSDYAIVGSDAGININGIGGCTTLSALSAAQQAVCIANFPIISFDENGESVTIIDAGSILNTGNYDSVFNSPDFNESIDWRLAGSAGEAVPEPSSFVLLLTGITGFFALVGYRLRDPLNH